MIRIPKLSEGELAILNASFASPTDIFLQGATLYFLDQKEDGLDKIHLASCGFYRDLRTKDPKIEKKTTDFLKRLLNGNVSSWAKLISFAQKSDNPQIQQIILKFCPLKKDQLSKDTALQTQT